MASDKFELRNGPLHASKQAFAYHVIWQLIVLTLVSVFLVALSLQQPWRKLLDSPDLYRFDTAKLQLQTVDTGTLVERTVDLPDQWRAGAPRTFQKTYRFKFDRRILNIPQLGFFVPFAKDGVKLRLNGHEVPAHRYTRGRTYLLWNRPLLFRFADDSLHADENLLELEVSSTGSSRIALGKVYLGPLEKMDALYGFFWRVQVAVPLAVFVLMILAAIAFAAYAPVGGVLYWVAAAFNLSAGLSMFNWLLVSPPLPPHVWYALVSIFEYLALSFMTLFMFLYLKLRSWLMVACGIFVVPILILSFAALFVSDMDTVMKLLESAEVAWGIGGIILACVAIWCYFINKSLDDQAIIWGVGLLIAFGLRDTFVHAGVLPASSGLHIPIGHVIVTLSMIFVFLRAAIRHSRELESYRAELGGRVGRHSREIGELSGKQSELEITAIVGRLSQIYSHELRNPIGTCLASGNLALKQLDESHEKLRAEARRIVESSMVCSELLGQMQATEEGLFPEDSKVPLMMPEWLIAHSEDLSTAIGCRLSVGESAPVKILAQPRSLLQALSLLLSDICDYQPAAYSVTAVVNRIESRAQLMFLFSQPVDVGASAGRLWTSGMASAKALLAADNASLEVLYDADGKVYACMVEAESHATRSAPEVQVVATR